MKKEIYLFPVLLSLFVSCTVGSIDEKPLDEQLDVKNVTVPTVTKTRATEEDFRVHLDEVMRYAALVEPEKEVESIAPYVQEGDTLMYYVYYNDGWKLISGDKRIQPELINEPTGKRTAEELCDGEKITVQEYVEFLSALKDYPYADKDTQYLDFWNKIGNKKPKKEEPKTRTVWEPNLENYPWLFHKIVPDEYDTYISYSDYQSTGNMTDTQWDQSSPWNSKIPFNCNYQRPPLGCVAVAVSQLLYYLYHEKNLAMGLYEDVSMSGYYVDGYNKQGVLTTEYQFIPSLSKSQFVLNTNVWNNMALTSSGTSTGILNAQDLMLVVGEGVQMVYKLEGSSSNIDKAKTYLNSIGISSTKADYSSTIALTSLQNGYPLYVRGEDYTYGGHAWLIDGYGTKHADIYQYWEWEKVYPSDPDFTPVYGDEYLTPDEVNNLGYYIYDGQTGYFLLESTYASFLMMNWGWGSIGRGTEYLDLESSAYWPIPGEPYNLNLYRKVLYNYSFSTRS